MNFCHDKADGNYLHPTSCEQYISCSNHLQYVMNCQPGLWYDTLQDACDKPHNVKCHGMYDVLLTTWCNRLLCLIHC